jgi:glutathione S-transferase
MAIGPAHAIVSCPADNRRGSVASASRGPTIASQFAIKSAAAGDRLPNAGRVIAGSNCASGSDVNVRRAARTSAGTAGRLPMVLLFLHQRLQAMLTVHHLNNSRSQRVLWLLEELGTPYEIRHYQRDGKTMLAPPELRAIHPLGKSPVITDGGLTIAETGAIVEYILETYGNGRLQPTEPEGHLRNRYWTHFAEGSAMPPLVMTLLFTEIPKRAPFFVRPIARMIGKTVQDSYLTPQLEAHLDLMEAELTRGTYFTGSTLTAADIMMSFPVEAAATRAALGARPYLTAWLGAIHARPAYQEALRKGGPYAYA